MSGERNRRPGLLALPGQNRPLQVMLLTLAPLADEVLDIFEQGIRQHFASDHRQHHALVDARAMRCGVLAVMAANARR